MIDGIDVTRKYTSDEIFQMYHKGQLRSISIAGYVTQTDVMDDTITFVPYHESTHFRDATDTMRTTTIHESTIDQKRKELEHEHPALRTTPQQKVARMMLRFMAEVERTGHITGLSDEYVKSIVGESWKVGDPYTAEVVQRVAQRFMEKAEVDNRAADSKRTTRLHPLA